MTGLGSFLVCAACRRRAHPRQLLVVVDTSGREPTRLVHRPGVPGHGACFLSVGPAPRFRIDLADTTHPDPVRPSPRVETPAPAAAEPSSRP